MKIADLPFAERPVLELLNLHVDRPEPDPDYTGYGWAQVDRIWVGALGVYNAVVLALHSADDGEPMADDIELEFDLPGGGSVLVLLSKFLEVWLPKLPPTETIVFAMCNPFSATLRPFGVRAHYGLGDVESWLEPGPRIRLAAETWCMVPA